MENKEIVVVNNNRKQGVRKLQTSISDKLKNIFTNHSKLKKQEKEKKETLETLERLINEEKLAKEFKWRMIEIINIFGNERRNKEVLNFLELGFEDDRKHFEKIIKSLNNLTSYEKKQ